MTEQIVKREHRTRPAAFGEAFWFSFFMGLGLCVGSAAAIYAIQYTQPMTFAVTFGAVGFVLMLLDRKREHDNRAYNITEQVIQEPAPEPAPEPQITPWIQEKTSGGRSIRHGRFNFTYAQWSAMTRLFVVDGKPLIRDNVATLKLFTNITKHWPGIEKEFKRMGWFTDEGKLTVNGSNWFSQFSPPLPQNTNGHVVVPLHQTTTDDDGDEGGVA